MEDLILIVSGGCMRELLYQIQELNGTANLACAGDRSSILEAMERAQEMRWESVQGKRKRMQHLEMGQPPGRL